MHYKNGREAKEGDAAIWLDNKKVRVGIVHSISVSSDTCNCQFAYVIPGTVLQSWATLKEMYHVEDALLAIEPLALEPKKL